MLEVLAGIIKQSKETAGDQVGNKESKVVLLADTMILYLKDSKSVTRKHLDIMKIFIKEEGNILLGYIPSQEYISLWLSQKRRSKEIRRKENERKGR